VVARDGRVALNLEGGAVEGVYGSLVIRTLESLASSIDWGCRSPGACWDFVGRSRTIAVCSRLN